MLSFSLVLIQHLVIDYLKRAGISFPSWHFFDRFAAFLAWGMLTSLVLAIISLTKERRPWLGLLALGVAGLFLFAWGTTY